MDFLDVGGGCNRCGREARIFPFGSRSQPPGSIDGQRLLISAVDDGVEAGHEKGAPEPDDGDDQPCGVKLCIGQRKKKKRLVAGQPE